MTGTERTLPSTELVEPKRSAPFACGFCGQNYYLPRPRSCCERGRQWDIGIDEARVAIGQAVSEAMK